MRPGIRTLLGTGFILAVAVIIANAVVSAVNTRRVAEHNRRVNQTTEDLGTLERIRTTLQEAEIGLHGYLLNGRGEDQARCEAALASIDGELLPRLEALRDVPDRQAQVGGFAEQVQGAIDVMQEALDLRGDGGIEVGVQILQEGSVKRTMEELRGRVDLMQAERRQFLKRQVAESEASVGRAVIAFVSASVIALLVITLLFVFLLRQLTSLRQAEETFRGQLGRWRVTLGSIGDAVIVTDGGGQVTFLNQMAEALCGWTPEEADRKPLTQVFRIINEETRQPAEDPFTQVLREGTIIGLPNSPHPEADLLAGPGDREPSGFALANRTALVARDGTERPICYNAAPIRDQTVSIMGVVLVFHDDTDRRRYERELLDANRRRDEFLAMLAHELRNPLASIRAAVEVFDMPAADGRLDWAKGVLGRQVNHLAHLLDDLLDVSRIIRGKIQLRKQIVDARPVIDHAVESVRPLIDDRRHKLEVAVAAEDLWLKADPVRLEQVLVNLLTNAAHYTPPGGRIGLAAETTGDRIVIRVRDTGMGIAPEVLPHIFELFAQGKRSLARTEGGLGVGLTIVKRLVELHGGSIQARSDGPGRGSEFIVRLPAAAPQQAVPAAPAVAPARRKGLKILIVDDNRDLTRGLVHLLKLLGHQVEAAFDGPSGIAVACASRPDVVLLDIGLPHLDGYQVARRLRQEEGLGRALIIAISGYAQEEDRRRSREAGMDHHLAKPVDLKTIAELIAQCRPVGPLEAVRSGT